MIEIKPLTQNTYNKFSIFLAGSIEMGVAENWQQRVAKDLQNYDVTLLNPRRDDWDSSWTQSIDNTQFNEQVNWELNGLKNADMVIVYFDPSTQSPITLMELGYCIGMGKKIIVCCPSGFYRKGNVDIICYLNSVPVVETYNEFIEQIKRMIYKMNVNILTQMNEQGN